MNYDFLSLFSISLVICSVLMSFVFVYAKRINNYSIVDGAWAFSFGLVALYCFGSGYGWGVRKLLMLTTVCIWSCRLGFFLSRRIYQHHPEEDGRYQDLRKQYGDKVVRGFYQFYQIQALSVVLLSVPFMLMATSPNPEVSIFEIIGSVVWLISIIGESIADAQLSRFKSDKANKGKVCDVGLWNYSRHPNYFFESCIWIGFYLMALGSPWGWITIYCPLFILFLVTKVTGIPPSEEQAIRTRGDAFRAYQAKTSAFVPWFHKKPTSPEA